MALRDKNAKERFFQSCISGNLNSIKSDLFHNVSPFIEDRYGNNALHLACMNNQPKVLQYLLKTLKTYKNDVQNKLGRTALNIAASQGAFECIVILLDNLQCDINSTDKNFKNTPLHWCIISKCVEGVKKLLNSGADFKMVNKSGKTPLQLAKTSCLDIFNIIEKFINNLDEDPCSKNCVQTNNNTKTESKSSRQLLSDLSQFKINDESSKLSTIFADESSKLDPTNFENPAKHQRVNTDTILEPNLTSSNSNESFFLDISKLKDGDNSVLNFLEKSIEPVDETSFVSSILNSGKVIQLTEAGILALEYTKNEVTTQIPDRLVKSFLTSSKQPCNENEINDNVPEKDNELESKTSSKGVKRLKSPQPCSKRLKYTESTVSKDSEIDSLLEQLNFKHTNSVPKVYNSSENFSQNVSSTEMSTTKNSDVGSKNQLVCLNSDVNGQPKWVEDLMCLLKDIVEYKSIDEPVS